MRYWFFGLFALLCGCVSTGLNEPKTNKVADVTVSISPGGDRLWFVDFKFSRPVSSVIFARPYERYRVNSWSADDPNAKLENISGIDALFFNEPALHTRIEIKTIDRDISLSRHPLFEFDDGNAVFLPGQFMVFEVKNRQQVEAAYGDVTRLISRFWDHQFQLNAHQKAILDGERVSAGGYFEFDIEPQFVYLGETSKTAYENFDGILDDSLPEWITKRFDADIGQIAGQYEEDFKRPIPHRPYIFAYANDLETPGFSYSGIASGNRTLVLRFKGRTTLKPTKRREQKLKFLLSHEIGHLFQRGKSELAFRHSASWTVEGSANWMTHLNLLAIGVYDETELKSDIRNSYSQCVSSFDGLFRVGGSTTSNRYYDCGEILALISDALVPDKTIFDIWNTTAQSKRGRALKPSTFFASLKALGAPPELVNRMEILANEKVERQKTIGRDRDYEGMLKQLMIDAGLKPEYSQSGELIDFQLP